VIGALISGGCGFAANPSKVVKVVLTVMTGFFSLYAMTALTHEVSWQTAFFCLPVLCLWIACGMHVCARIRRRQLNIRWIRTVLTAAAVIMIGFFAAAGMPLMIGLVLAGPTTLLALAYWFKSGL